MNIETTASVILETTANNDFMNTTAVFPVKNVSCGNQKNRHGKNLPKTAFKPGISGNPSGLPKDTWSLKRSMLRGLTREAADELIERFLDNVIKADLRDQVTALRFIAELLKEIGPLSAAVNIQLNNGNMNNPELLERFRSYETEISSSVIKNND